MYIPAVSAAVNFAAGHLCNALCRNENDILESRRSFWHDVGCDATIAMFIAAALAGAKHFKPDLDLVKKIPLSKIQLLGAAGGSLAMMPISDVAQQVYETHLAMIRARE